MTNNSDDLEYHLPKITGKVDKLSAEPQANDEQRVLQIIDLQSFEGGFEDCDAVLLILGLSTRKMNVETRAEELGQTLQVWITAVVVAYLRNRLAAYHDIFELVLDKAVDFGKEHVKAKGAGNTEDAWEALERAALAWVDEQ